MSPHTSSRFRFRGMNPLALPRANSNLSNALTMKISFLAVSIIFGTSFAVSLPIYAQNSKPAVTKTTQKTPTAADARAKLVFSQDPAPPARAREQHLQGAGVWLLHFKPDGTVEKVETKQSTGAPILDDAAISCYKRWKCQPGALQTLSVPFTFVPPPA